MVIVSHRRLLQCLNFAVMEKDMEQLLAEQHKMRTELDNVHKNEKSMLGLIYIILACLGIICYLLSK